MIHIFFPIAVVLGAIAALSAMAGRYHAAVALLLSSIGIGCLGEIVWCLVVVPWLAQTHAQLQGELRHLDFAQWAGIALVAITVLAGIAGVRFINHRRKLVRWIGESPTSLKRRLDRD